MGVIRVESSQRKNIERGKLRFMEEISTALESNGLNKKVIGGGDERKR
jgi:hypothetical protein